MKMTQVKICKIFEDNNFKRKSTVHAYSNSPIYLLALVYILNEKFEYLILYYEYPILN